jgi:hypothetical protein
LGPYIHYERNKTAVEERHRGKNGGGGQEGQLLYKSAAGKPESFSFFSTFF